MLKTQEMARILTEDNLIYVWKRKETEETKKQSQKNC